MLRFAFVSPMEKPLLLNTYKSHRGYPMRTILRFLAVTLILGLLLCGCMLQGQGPAETASSSGPITGLTPAKALSPAPSLIPGLTVLYFPDFFASHIDELPSGRRRPKRANLANPSCFWTTTSVTKMSSTAARAAGSAWN